MKLVKKVLKEKSNIIFWMVLLIINIVLFLPWLKGHYTTDTYEIMQMGYGKYAKEVFLVNGRIFSAILLIVAEKVNISIETLVGTSLLVSLFISTLSVIKLYSFAIKKLRDNNILIEILIIISYSIIFNFFYIEDLFFIETAIMALSVYLIICAADIFISSNKHYIIKTGIVLLISTICYNGSITIFPLIAILFHFIKEDNRDWRLFFKKICQIILICAVVLILDLLLIKLMSYITNQNDNTRISVNLTKNIGYILKNGGSVIVNTSNIFPKYLFIGFTILVVLNMVIVTKGKKTSYILDELILVCIGVVGPFCIYISTLSSFGSGRLHVAMGMLIGILMLYNFVKIEEQRKSRVFALIVIVYFLVNVINYAIIIKEHEEVNKINETNVIEIKQYVEEYEKTNNKDVKYIAMKLVPGKIRKSIL